jgi:small-conductance mechanosensitive channel
LNLVLRVYLPNLDKRLGTTTEINTEISRRFAEAGIEIPFPQQDLHLRTGWERFSRDGGLDELATDFTPTH